MGRDRQRSVVGPATASLVILVAIVGLAVTALFNVTELGEQATHRVEAVEAARRLDDLLLAVTEAETGQRGYLLTGESAYLEPYHMGVENAGRSLEELREELPPLVPNVVPTLDRLAEAVDAKLEELAETIRLHDEVSPEVALELVTSDIGFEHMRLARELHDDLSGLLEAQRTVMKADGADAKWFSALSIVATLLLALVAAAAALVSTNRQDQLRLLTTSRAEDAARRLSGLADVASALARTRDREAVLGLAADECLHLLHAEVAVVRLQDAHRVAVSPAAAALRNWDATADPHPVGLEAEAQGFSQSLDATLGPVRQPGDLSNVVAHALRNRDEAVVGHLLVAEPLTGRFDPSARLVLAQLAQLVAIALDTVDLLDELTIATREREHFMAMLGHELRNPLNGISGAVQLLARRGLAESEPQLFGILDRQSKMMRRLVDDLLDVARIQRGKLALQVERVDLAALTAEVVADQADAAVEHTVPDQPVWVLADRQRIRQCITNLLDNARKFGNGLPVAVRVGVEGGQAWIDVEDQGQGMSEAEVGSVFERYAQGRSGHQGGLGLGLALVDGVMALHGGSAEVTSAGKGEGSCFTLRLAVTDQPALVQAPDDAAVPEARRILVVDDRLDARLTLGGLLELDGHDVVQASNGEEALVIQARDPAAAVFCDINMGAGIDGYTVARTLRDEHGSEALLVAVTGYGDEASAARSAKAGFDHHLAKPVTVEAVRDVLLRGR